MIGLLETVIWKSFIVMRDYLQRPINSGQYPSENARIIVTNVSMKVQANQEFFTMFISALKEPGLENLAKKLK